MSSPTESAEKIFQTAINNFNLAQTQLVNKQTEGLIMMGLGLQQTAWGMKHLSVGLRATYILLEKVERLLEEQQRQRR